MKKGFTLIELLAVIVILAIIAVIAVPIVINIIDETKENATLRSADNYIKTIETTLVKKSFNKEIDYSNCDRLGIKKYSCSVQNLESNLDTTLTLNGQQITDKKNSKVIIEDGIVNNYDLIIDDTYVAYNGLQTTIEKANGIFVDNLELNFEDEKSYYAGLRFNFRIDKSYLPENMTIKTIGVLAAYTRAIISDELTLESELKSGSNLINALVPESELNTIEHTFYLNNLRQNQGGVKISLRVYLIYELNGSEHVIYSPITLNNSVKQLTSDCAKILVEDYGYDSSFITIIDETRDIYHQDYDELLAFVKANWNTRNQGL